MLLLATTKRISSSVDTVGGDEDPLTQILFHLPITSLLRFKSISKHWLSHHKPCVLSYPPPKQCSSASYRLIFAMFISPYQTTRIRFCTFQYHKATFQDAYFRLRSIRHYIYNPTINQFTTLPQPHYLSLINPQFTYATAVNLAFDPSKSPNYEVILVYTLPGIYYEMEIYSSETGLWKRTNESIRLQVNFRLGVFWNGVINWSGRWGNSLYFNAQEERIGTIPMPPIPEDFGERRLMYFGVSNNHLHLVEIYGPRTTIFNVYEMERDYSGWFVKYRVDLHALMNAFPESISRYLDPSDLRYYRFVIPGLFRGEDDEDSFLVLHIPGKAIGYRFRDRTFRKLCDFPLGETDIECDGTESSLKFNGWFDAFEFVESLSCV
ncbi:hypothetical protein LguiA_029896 [Lonicera macranthoides]